MSLITNKSKAIIYCAENLISGKKYIGKTSRSLENRMKDHFRHTIKYTHHFANALKYYPRDSWEWTILAEVDCDKVDEYERFFIADLDTCNIDKGYNTSKGGGIEGVNNLAYNPEIITLYNLKYGEVKGTRLQLKMLYPELDRIRDLISGKRKHLNGWVLGKNRDNLINRNKRGKLVTLTHEKYGTFTLLQQEFVTRFNLTRVGVSILVAGKQKTHRGWKLIGVKE